MPEINARLRWTIALIAAAAIMVLVIACANAAGLQLARPTTRQQELGMRLSLGASRARLIRQLVTESALLGVLAGSLALPVTWAILHVAVTKAAENLPTAFTFILPVRPDLEVLTYVLIVSMFAGVLFGLAPAMAGSRNALFSITRGMGTSLARGRLRHALIAAQVAVSLTLMIAGGLLVRSASQAISMETGYDGERVLEVSLQFPDDRTARTGPDRPEPPPGNGSGISQRSRLASRQRDVAGHRHRPRHARGDDGRQRLAADLRPVTNAAASGLSDARPNARGRRCGVVDARD